MHQADPLEKKCPGPVRTEDRCRRSEAIQKFFAAVAVLTRLIEQQSAKLPSHFFLFSAFGAMAASLAFELSGRSRASRFVGMWPPALLMMGMYNKLVKILGAR